MSNLDFNPLVYSTHPSNPYNHFNPLLKYHSKKTICVHL